MAMWPPRAPFPGCSQGSSRPPGVYTLFMDALPKTYKLSLTVRETPAQVSTRHTTRGPAKRFHRLLRKLAAGRPDIDEAVLTLAAELREPELARDYLREHGLGSDELDAALEELRTALDASMEARIVALVGSMRPEALGRLKTHLEEAEVLAGLW